MRPAADSFSRSASGRSRVRLRRRMPGECVMATLRRTPRTVYRVYNEQDYLAGTDALTGWQIPSIPPIERERRLRRLAGAAVLTGALGAVGGLLFATAVPVRPADRQIAAISTPRTRRGLTGMSIVLSARAVRAARMVRAVTANRATASRRSITGSRRAAAGDVGTFTTVFAARSSSLPGRIRAARPPSSSHAQELAVGRYLESATATAVALPQRSQTEAETTSATATEFGFER